MKKNKMYVVLLICSILCIKGYSQEKSDIGLTITNDKSSALMLEFRKPFAEKYHFIISASRGGDIHNGNYGDILEVNDTMVIERRYNSINSSSFLRIGVERQIKTSMFYYGIDYVLGYQKKERSNGNYGRTLIDGNWHHWYAGSSTRAKDHYLVQGLQLHVSMDVPLGCKERFLLNLQYAGSFYHLKYIKRTDINDPLNEFEMNTLSGWWKAYFDGRFSIGLKYKLGKKESSTAEDINL